MSTRENMRVEISTFKPEDQQRLLEETILEWQKLGPAAIWNAIYDTLDWWFMARGLDPEVQKVDRTHIEIHAVPWLASSNQLAPQEEPKGFSGA